MNIFNMALEIGYTRKEGCACIMEHMKWYREGFDAFLSVVRRMVRLLLLAVLVLPSSTPLASAASMTLLWDPNTEPDLSGYSVHYGLASWTYTTHINAGITVSRTVAGLLGNAAYYFAVIARDSLETRTTKSQCKAFSGGLNK